MYWNELLKIFKDPVSGAFLIVIAFVALTVFFYLVSLLILLRIRKESIRTNRNLGLLINLFLKRKKTSPEKKEIKDRVKFKLDDKDIKKLKDIGVGLE